MCLRDRFRLGAKVTGIDASEKNIKIAKFHSKKQNLKINYLCTSPDNMKGKEKFDVILNMEIVEHVDNLDLFLKESSNHLKKNGIMFIATLNKTLKSYVFAIVGFDGGLLKKNCNDYIHIKSIKGEYGPVEDIQLIINHILAHWFQKIFKKKSP